MEIKNYPDYLIYPDGKVFSKKQRPGFMKHNINRNYHWVSIDDVNGKKHTLSVHRIVAQHYIPNPNNYPQVDHIDRNTSNNSLDNLRWVTPAMNNKNKGMYKTNKSGFKNIHYSKAENTWRVQYKKPINKIKRFKTKKEALCYKYIIELRIKADHFTLSPTRHQI
tara:strand:- start:512 stop:1006 length:495 start_codon:yes stop_codon:yes gene_type:complete